jgi:hypothetical protein
MSAAPVLVAGSTEAPVLARPETVLSTPAVCTLNTNAASTPSLLLTSSECVPASSDDGTVSV